MVNKRQGLEAFLLQKRFYIHVVYPVDKCDGKFGILREYYTTPLALITDLGKIITG
ncbi:MAG: hypothetical protein LBQ00_06930 [Syntrophobacterales bacterium]|nr:hypothetical protein [Syntrophobacterales bacterium]